MTLIEGVGDEVVQFIIMVVLIMIATLAWRSTNTRPNRHRTVLLMRSRSQHPVTVSIRQRSTTVTTTQANSSTQNVILSVETTTTNSVNEAPRENSRVISLQEMDSIVDADMAMLDNNRLHFYRRVDFTSNNDPISSEPENEQSDIPEEPESASNEQIREMDSIVDAMEAEETEVCDYFNRSSGSNESANSTVKNDENNSADSSEATPFEQESENASTVNEESEGDRRKILIKLKYLNDTLKEVEGSLDELLKDFKWRHFSTELSTENRVSLIFNGRVLGDEAATLQACGLHHLAVVHCLVHPKRNNNQPRTEDEVNVTTTHELITEVVQPERTWDLENVLMTLVSVALTVVWFFRCEYSNMFTASASVALFGLTVFYSVAIFGLYLSDTFHVERRNPVPRN